MKLLPDEIENQANKIEKKESDAVFCIETTKHVSSRRLYDIDAIKQAVFCVLATEQKAHEIYPSEFGLQTIDLLDKPFGYVASELCRRIKESLMKDPRIEDVLNFDVKKEQKDSILIQFDVETIYGVISEQYSTKIIREEI